MLQDTIVIDDMSFNSLSRDHRSPATDDRRRRRHSDNFQLPLSGSQASQDTTRGLVESMNFQLPLSGSLPRNELIGDAVAPLSTPSLGITGENSR